MCTDVKVPEGFVLIPMETAMYAKYTLDNTYRHARSEIAQECNKHIGIILDCIKEQSGE